MGYNDGDTRKEKGDNERGKQARGLLKGEETKSDIFGKFETVITVIDLFSNEFA